MPAGCWGQWRRTQRYAAIPRNRRRCADGSDRSNWPVSMVATATGESRAAVANGAGWQVGKDRVQRNLGVARGLKVPQKQRPPKEVVAETMGSVRTAAAGACEITCGATTSLERDDA